MGARERREIWGLVFFGTGKMLFVVSITILMFDALRPPLWLARVANAAVLPSLLLLALGFVLLVWKGK